jgi:hypothetical protein
MKMQQDALGIYDIYTVIYTPFWQRMWIKWALAFFGLLVISFLMWWFMRTFIFSKKIKKVPPRQIVLQKIKQLKNAENMHNIQKLYADLGFVLRLFFTDWHGHDMLSLTEHEIENHIVDCVLCIEQLNHYAVYTQHNGLSSSWHTAIKELLNRMSDVKYKAEHSVQNELIKRDIDLVTTLVHNVYLKK